MRTRAITPPWGARRIRVGVMAGLLSACLPMPAEAQIGSVVVRAPRPFGLFVGDRFDASVEIEAADGFAPQAASLPKPGPLTYWLDLTAVSVAPGPAAGPNPLSPAWWARKAAWIAASSGCGGVQSSSPS